MPEKIFQNLGEEGEMKFVDSAEKKSFDEEDVPEAGNDKKKKEAEGLEKFRAEGQKFIDARRKSLMTFAKDVSLDFKMSDGFFIDLEKGEVNLDTQWFRDQGFTREQILWAIFHELSHFRDLAEDPKNTMENFDYIRGKAKETGEVMMKKWEEKFGESDPELIKRLKKSIPNKKHPERAMNRVEAAAYKIHHTFYNIFDDIHVNNLVARKAPAYEKDSRGGDEVERLYQEKLFVEKDFSKLPRHMQFIYKCIRQEMVPGEEAAVSGEVQDIFDKKIIFQGKEYSVKEIIDTFLKTKSKRDTKSGKRYFVLQKTLEPIFDKLVMKDLEEWNPEKPKKPENGEGGGGGGEEGGESANPFQDNYDDHDEKNPDQFDEDDIENWIEKKKEDEEKDEEAKKAKEENDKKSAGEKANDAQNSMDKAWAEKNGISQNTMERFRKIEREVEPYLDELSRLWEKIIYGSKRVLDRETQGHFKDGTELDVQQAINEWPRIEKGELEKVRVMKKDVLKERLVQKPEMIRVRISGDLSGSMDQEKKHILEQCLVLLLSSLKEFQDSLDRTRSLTKSKLQVDTEAWVFGDEENARRIKKIKGEGAEEEQVEIVKTFTNLEQTLGSTDDNRPLEEIYKSITPEEKEKISEQKILEIVFEITDGGSTSAEKTIKAVNDLLEVGVVARAFQIGKVEPKDEEIFNGIWNDGREEKLGEKVGENIANLLPAITDALKKYLSNVRL